MKKGFGEELLKYLNKGDKIGMNPFKFQKKSVERMTQVLNPHNIEFVPDYEDLVTKSLDCTLSSCYQKIVKFEIVFRNC